MGAHSDTELRRFSQRLLHESQVFFRVGRAMVKTEVGFGTRPGWEIETALVESFAMHTRALVDFFFTFETKRQRDNAFAFHFFDRVNRWDHLASPVFGPWLRQIRDRDAEIDRFGKQLAHLTYHEPSISDYARGWPVMQITKEIGVVLNVFIKSVSPMRVTADFKTKATREIPLAARLEPERLAMAVWTSPATTRRLTG